MQRSWIIGVSVAFVMGTAGASYAAIARHDPAAPATALAQAPVVTSGNSATYRIGGAGVVTVANANGVLSIASSTASDGWTFIGSTAPAAHVEAQFSDGTQTVTFAADLVDGKIVVSVSSEATVTTDSSSASSVPIEVTQMSDPAAGSTSVTTPVAVRPGTTQPWVPTTPASTTVHTTTSHPTTSHPTQHPTTVPHRSHPTTTVPRTTVPHPTVTTEPHTTHTTISTPTTRPATHPTEPTEPSND
jgi:hypothetical protein